MKKMISMILSALMLMSTFAVVTVSASTTSVQPVGSKYSGDTGDCKWKFNKNNGTLTIYGNGEMDYYYTDLDAFDFDAYDSAEEREKAFKEACKPNTPWYSFKDDIKSLVVKNGVENIGAYSLYCCENLTSVTLPDSINRIEDYAFYDCIKLKSITVPKNCELLSYNSFLRCKKLSKVDFAEGDTEVTIGSWAFYDCDSLKSFNVSARVKEIEEAAFCTPNFSKFTVDKDNKYFEVKDDVLYERA